MSHHNKKYDPSIQRSKSSTKKPVQQELTHKKAKESTTPKGQSEEPKAEKTIADATAQPVSPAQPEAVKQDQESKEQVEIPTSATPQPKAQTQNQEPILSTKPKPSKTPDPKNKWLAKHFQGIDLKSLKKSLNNDTLHYSPSKMSSYRKTAELFVLLDDDFLDRYYERTPGKSTQKSKRRDPQESPSLRLLETSMKQDQAEPTDRILDLDGQSYPASPDLAYTPSVIEKSDIKP